METNMNMINIYDRFDENNKNSFSGWIFNLVLCRIIPQVPNQGDINHDKNSKKLQSLIDPITYQKTIKFHPVVWLLSWFRKPRYGTCGMILHNTVRVMHPTASQVLRNLPLPPSSPTSLLPPPSQAMNFAWAPGSLLGTPYFSSYLHPSLHTTTSGWNCRRGM